MEVFIMEEKNFNIGEYLKRIEEEKIYMEGDYKQQKTSLFYSNVIVNYEEEGVLC